MKIKHPFIRPLENSTLGEFDEFLKEKAIIDARNKNLMDKFDFRYSPCTFTKLYLAKKGYFLEILMEDQDPVVQNYAKAQYNRCQAQIKRYKKQLKMKDPEFQKDLRILRALINNVGPYYSLKN